MARRRRTETIGFYYILNYGAEKQNIFLDDEDFLKFLEIIDDSAIAYNFTVFTFSLMSDHYRLLLRTTHKNLSLLMRQINSRYGIYFNHKYKRVGPLFQGRFKSWFVHDEHCVNALAKYIELNALKTDIENKAGHCGWSMSSYAETLYCANNEFIDGMDVTDGMNNDELDNVKKVLSANVELKEDAISIENAKKPAWYFTEFATRERAIAEAIADGYKQTAIASYLNVSNVTISKIYKKYRQKVQLFNKLRDKGIFWSYSKKITYCEASTSMFIEHLLKYGDFDDIKLGVELFGKRVLFKVWDKRLKSDKQFIKLNLMLARIFFGMDVESSYFKEVKNERFEKLKLLAS